jgi:hypothetical protein
MIKGLAGFLDSKSGQIRDRKTLAELDAKLKSSEIDDEDAVEVDSNEKSIKNALGSVRSRTYEQTNSAINNAHSALSDAKSAREHIKKENDTLKALESAIKDGDTDKAEKLKAEFGKLQEERKILAEKINVNNETRSATTVRFGNKELYKSSNPDIEFKETLSSVDLDKVKDIRKLRREEILVERKEINETQKNLKNDLNQLKETVVDLDNKVSILLDNDEKARIKFHNDYEEASSLTNETANNLIQIGSQAELVHAISSNALKLLQ